MESTRGHHLLIKYPKSNANESSEMRNLGFRMNSRRGVEEPWFGLRVGPASFTLCYILDEFAWFRGLFEAFMGFVVKD
jgi:hypothetical protein